MGWGTVLHRRFLAKHLLVDVSYHFCIGEAADPFFAGPFLFLLQSLSDFTGLAVIFTPQNTDTICNVTLKIRRAEQTDFS